MKIAARSLPDFLIVGAQKAATTTLYHILKQHSGVFLPGSKEPCFFAYRGNREKALSLCHAFNYSEKMVPPMVDLDAYAKLFERAAPEKVIGEASTHYLYDHDVCIKNIKEVYGNNYRRVKIIILLRNPAKRAFSSWSMLVRNGTEDMEFIEAVKRSDERKIAKRVNDYDYVGFGMYYKQVKDYMENFDHVKIILQEDIEADINRVVADSEKFLNLDELPLDTDIKLNASGIMKNRKMARFLYSDNWVKTFFKKIFPQKIGLLVKSKIERRLVTSVKLQKNDEEYLRGVFKDDVKKLSELLDTPKVLNWVE